MALTPRRVETLNALRRAVDQAGEAVHYSLVAVSLRTSAWTAYDLLRELEALGLVVRSYGERQRRPGRSRILFRPAQAEAPAWEETLRAAFERFVQIADDTAAATTYLADPAADLGYHVGYFLSRLVTAGRQASSAALTVLEGRSTPAAKIQALTALGLGTVLARLRSRLAARVSSSAARFGVLIDEAARADASLEALVSAASSLAAHAWDAPGSGPMKAAPA